MPNTTVTDDVANACPINLRSDYRSWGGILRASHFVARPTTAMDVRSLLVTRGEQVALAAGLGRSYGDVGLNPGGLLIDCRGLDHFIAFDRSAGLLECEAGVTLADILAVICRPDPDGSAWFLPVSPGTRFVTLGGAIANDVHGKNHHRFGTIGRHIAWIELVRSDGALVRCSPGVNEGLFAATIGGLGLTGVIVRAGLQLRRVAGTALEMEDIQFDRLSDFFDLSAESDARWEYTAAWIDGTATGRALGRGIFSRARHAAAVGADPPSVSPSVAVPLTSPFPLINPCSVRALNAIYRRKLGFRGRRRAIGPYAPVFYPLDAIGEWRRLYGACGFFQFQSVVPEVDSHNVISELLNTVTRSGQWPSLAVLKLFGSLPSPGMLSFPRPGATLALDFPNRGRPTRDLLSQLEQIAVDAGGRIYPAKDSVMSAESFQRGYPRLGEYLPFVDPAFSSAFAQRIGIRQVTKATA